ncbi:MAG: type II and III secretion system family protein [Alphaproteobacteria bacterium]|nr:type II and III secretion system family protein [Alphaproteobacteria bacterium]
MSCFSLFQSKPSKYHLIIGCLLAGSLSLSACDLAKNQLKMDREKGMEFQDYRDAMAPRLPEVDKNEAADRDSIPPLQPYVAMPDSNIKAMPLVSININQNVPLRNALYQLAEQAEFDAEVDPRIEGSVIFSARQKPLDQVLERLSELAGLRYTMEDDFVRIELDTPYHKIYSVQYLNIVRENSSSISNNVSVVSGDGSDTGSSFEATNTSTSDFWNELDDNLTQILLLADTNVNALTTEDTPTVSSVSSTPTTIEPVLLDQSDVDGAPEVQVQAPDVTLEVGEVEEGEEGAEEEASEAQGPQPFDARYSINRQAGIISVYAPDRVHVKVAEYLDEIKKRVASQVLIEAKVLEVTLSDEYSAGVDWSQIDLFGKNEAFFDLEVTGTGGLVRGVIDQSTNPQTNLALSFTGNDFTLLVDALSEFGTVSSLSSPRLTVMNNQSSVLNVAANIVFFEIEVETEILEGGGTITTFDTDAQTVPEGVLINVLPSINLDNDTVTMAIRPTVTSVITTVDDPNPALAAAGVRSEVPVLNVQEFDSIVTLNNGQTIVMGGLMQDRVTGDDNGVPVVSEVPLLGNLFKNSRSSISKTELIVLLKATIVEQGNTIHPTDKDLYRTFSRDRRPFKL